MKRVVLLVLLVVASVLGIDALADATQNRGDAVDRNSRVTIVFDVATRHYAQDEDTAARALWSVCAATTGNRVVEDLAPVEEGWAVTLQPALGHHGQKRMVGCLEDTTIDRVIGHVVRLEIQQPRDR